MPAVWQESCEAAVFLNDSKFNLVCIQPSHILISLPRISSKFNFMINLAYVDPIQIKKINYRLVCSFKKRDIRVVH